MSQKTVTVEKMCEVASSKSSQDCIKKVVEELFGEPINKDKKIIVKKLNIIVEEKKKFKANLRHKVIGKINNDKNLLEKKSEVKMRMDAIDKYLKSRHADNG